VQLGEERGGATAKKRERERERERDQPRIGGPTGGKSRNEGSYLGGSLSPAITPGSGAARKRGGGRPAHAAVRPYGGVQPPHRRGVTGPIRAVWNYIKMKS